MDHIHIKVENSYLESQKQRLQEHLSGIFKHEELCCSLVNTAPQSPSRCLGARYSREDLPFWKRVPVHATLTCLNTSPLAELLQTLLNLRHSSDVEDNQVSLARR